MAFKGPRKRRALVSTPLRPPPRYILYAPQRRRRAAGGGRRAAGGGRRGTDEREELLWEMQLRRSLGVDNIWCGASARRNTRLILMMMRKLVGAVCGRGRAHIEQT